MSLGRTGTQRTADRIVTRHRMTVPSTTSALIASLTAVTPLDTLGPPTDNSNLNASVAAHGLLRKLSNVPTEFLSGVGSFSTPALTPEIGQVVVAAVPTTSGTITLATGAGQDTLQYIKIGRLVHVNGVLIVGSVAAPLGQFTVTGLPYPAASILFGYSAANLLLNSWAASFTGMPMGVLVNGTSVLSLFEFAAGVAGAATAAKCIAGAVIAISLTYQTD